MRASDLNDLLARGESQAALLEPQLITAYEDVIVWAGRQMSRNMRKVPVLVAAGEADWNPPLMQDLIDEEALNEKVIARTRPIQERMLVATVGGVMVDAGIDWTIRHPLSQELLNQLGARANDVADGLREPVARAIAKSFVAGDSVPHTARAILQATTGVKGWQATMLARNDLIGTANGGALMAARMVKAATDDAPGFKQWLSAGDALVRKSHAQASGQTVPLDQPFSVGSSYLDHPGDPSGAHADVINCRCVMLFVDAPPGVMTQAAQETSAEDAPVEVFQGGQVEQFDRMLWEERVQVENGMEVPDWEDEYAASYARLEADVAKWGPETSNVAKVEGYDAATRVTVDDVITLRDEKGELLGIASYNRPLPLSEARVKRDKVLHDLDTRDYGQWLDDKEFDELQLKELDKLIGNYEQGNVTVGVNHLASSGVQRGVGARLMKQIAEDAAELDLGVGLNALEEAAGFYARLGMKRVGNDFYWTAEEARDFAQGVHRPKVIPDIPLPPSSELLPAYSRRPAGELTHAEARDEIKRLGSYMSLLRWQIKNGKRDAADVAKVEAMDERRKVLRARLKEPDISPVLRPELPDPNPPETPPLEGESERMRTLRQLHAEMQPSRTRDPYNPLRGFATTTEYGDHLDAQVQRAGALVMEEVEHRLRLRQFGRMNDVEFFQTERRLDGNMRNEADLATIAEQRWIAEHVAPDYRGVRNRYDLWKLEGTPGKDYVQAVKDQLDELPQNVKLHETIAELNAFRKLHRPDLKKERREVTFEVLGEVREFGGAKVAWAERPDKKTRMIDKAMRYFPRQWIEDNNEYSADNDAYLDAMTDKEARTARKGLRMASHYNHWGNRVYVSGEFDAMEGDPAGVAVAAHEMMHRFEHLRDTVAHVDGHFYRRRTVGEELRPIGAGYDANELFRPDEFKNKYQGKDYQSFGSWELMTMGVQGLVDGRDSSGSWASDPDFWRHVLGVLTLL